MTTLTRIPKNVQIQTLPYMGDKKKRQAKHRKYAIHAQIDGVLPKIGASYATLAAAQKKAAELSLKYGSVCIMDQSQSVGQRMVAIYKKGLNYLAK